MCNPLSALFLANIPTPCQETRPERRRICPRLKARAPRRRPCPTSKRRKRSGSKCNSLQRTTIGQGDYSHCIPLSSIGNRIRCPQLYISLSALVIPVKSVSISIVSQLQSPLFCVVTRRWFHPHRDKGWFQNALTCFNHLGNTGRMIKAKCGRSIVYDATWYRSHRFSRPCAPQTNTSRILIPHPLLRISAILT